MTNQTKFKKNAGLLASLEERSPRGTEPPRLVKAARLRGGDGSHCEPPLAITNSVMPGDGVGRVEARP